MPNAPREATQLHTALLPNSMKSIQALISTQLSGPFACHCLGILIFFGLIATDTAADQPPFNGTIFVVPNIVIDSDPTAFVSIAPNGREERRMYDRRANGWITSSPFLFVAEYDDDRTIEVQVNPEFGDAETAFEEARRYADAIGRMPAVLRQDVETVWIHQGVRPFGGGNNNILIHTGQSERYVAQGILKETLIHEAAHTSLDRRHARSEGWRAAQEADGRFISTYARSHPFREDIAESYLLYFALRYRRDRIPDSLAATIEETMPHRIAYFDAQDFPMHPVVPTGSAQSE